MPWGGHRFIQDAWVGVKWRETADSPRAGLHRGVLVRGVVIHHQVQVDGVGSGVVGAGDLIVSTLKASNN